MALEPKHQTVPQLLRGTWRKAREAKRAGDNFRFHRLVTRILDWQDAGEITAAQARNSYNDVYNKALTAAEWTALKTTGRLANIRTRYIDMVAEVDE